MAAMCRSLEQNGAKILEQNQSGAWSQNGAKKLCLILMTQQFTVGKYPDYTILEVALHGCTQKIRFHSLGPNACSRAIY